MFLWKNRVVRYLMLAAVSIVYFLNASNDWTRIVIALIVVGMLPVLLFNFIRSQGAERWLASGWLVLSILCTPWIFNRAFVRNESWNDVLSYSILMGIVYLSITELKFKQLHDTTPGRGKDNAR